MDHRRSPCLHATVIAVVLVAAFVSGSTANYLKHACPCFCSERDSSDSSFYREMFGIPVVEGCHSGCHTVAEVVAAGNAPLAYVLLLCVISRLVMHVLLGLLHSSLLLAT